MQTALMEYRARRMRLAEKWTVGQGAILLAAPQVKRNADVHYPYRQNSHFFYLTGLAVPDIAVLLLK